MIPKKTFQKKGVGYLGDHKEMIESRHFDEN